MRVETSPKDKTFQTFFNTHFFTHGVLGCKTQPFVIFPDNGTEDDFVGYLTTIYATAKIVGNLGELVGFFRMGFLDQTLSFVFPFA